MTLVGEALLEMEILAHLATLRTDPETEVAWENVAHNGSLPRLEVQHFPNTTLGPTFGDFKEYRGFLQVTVVTEDGGGTIQPRTIAAQVASHFNGETLFTAEHRIQFSQPASVRPALIDQGQIRFPVDAPYIATQQE